MTRPLINDGGIEREMTDKEHDEWLQLNADRQAENDAAVALVSSARNKLKAIGLTDAEIAALVG